MAGLVSQLEAFIAISQLNDFIFCPRSIYFHNLFGGYSTQFYHRGPQTAGRVAHQSIEDKTYSTKKEIITGLEVYSGKYGLGGKIDIFDQENKLLIERKNRITIIYDGYFYQLYAQYFCLSEMGYAIEKLAFHSLSDNQRYFYPPPGQVETEEFENLLTAFKSYDLEKNFIPNLNKCRQCVYSQLCDLSCDYEE